MSIQCLKLAIYYIRPENSADMALHTSVSAEMRLNELETMCRSLLLTPRCDDYLSLIFPNMKMIEESKSLGESQLKMLSKSHARYKLFENWALGYTDKGISGRVVSAGCIVRGTRSDYWQWRTSFPSWWDMALSVGAARDLLASTLSRSPVCWMGDWSGRGGRLRRRLPGCVRLRPVHSKQHRQSLHESCPATGRKRKAEERRHVPIICIVLLPGSFHG
jgi:hypothetical protein